MSSKRMRINYNHFLDLIEQTLADNENAWTIEVGLNLLNSYLKAIAERALELKDETLIGLLSDMSILKESSKEVIQTRLLAEDIEQFFYERGEYDYFGKDRIRWLESLIEREDVVKRIYDALEKADYIPLIDYFAGEIAVLDEADENLAKAESLLDRLNQYNDKK